MKATTTQVSIFGHEFEVALADDKNLYMTARQFNQLTSFQAHPEHSSRALKRLMGQEFKQARLVLNGDKTASSAFAITQLRKVLMKLVLKGNSKAIELMEDLADLALTELCFDAFGVEFSKNERQLYVETRMASKAVRRTFTDATKDHGELHGYSPNYGKLTAIFYGITGLKKGRDSYTTDQLNHCIWCETFLVKQVDKGVHPERALKLLKEVL